MRTMEDEGGGARDGGRLAMVLKERRQHHRVGYI